MTTSVILLCSLILSQKVKLAVRTEDFGLPGIASYDQMNELKKNYAFEDKLTLIFSKKKALSSIDYCQLYTWLKKEFFSNSNIENISSIFDLRTPVYTTLNGPKLLYPKTLEQLCTNNFQTYNLEKHPFLPLFSTRSLSDSVIYFEIKKSKVELKYGIYDYKIVDDIIKSAEKNLPDFKIYKGGTLFFQKSILDGIKRSEIVNLAASLLLLLGFYYFYRSLFMGITLLLIIFFTNLILKAGMTIFGHKIDPLTSCLFLMITIAIIEDYIFLNYLLLKKKFSFNLSIKKLLLPSFLTSLSTSIGFGSLAISNNPSLKRFAMWTSLGSMLEWFFIFMILPVIYDKFPFFRNRILLLQSKVIKYPKFSLSKIHLKKSTLVPLLLAPAFVFIIFHQANINYSPYDMFKDKNAITQYREYMLNSRKYEGEISLVLPKNLPEEQLYSILNDIKKVPEIAEVQSMLQLNYLLKNTPPEIQRLIIEDVSRSSIGKLFNSPSDQRIILNIKSINTKNVPILQKKLESICHLKCQVVGDVITSKDYALNTLQTLYDSLALCYLLIILLLTWLVRAVDKKYFLPILLSSIWATLTLLLLVILLQIKISVVTCIALSVVVGLTGDNAIQFLLISGSNLQNSVHEYGNASLEVFVLMGIMSLCLSLGYFKSTQILSFFMLLSVILMYIGDVWILNSFLIKKKFN